MQDERLIQAKELSNLQGLIAQGGDPAEIKKLRERIRKTHEIIPWQNLALESARCLHSNSGSISAPKEIRDLLKEFELAQVDDNPPMPTDNQLASLSPVRNTPPPNQFSNLADDASATLAEQVGNGDYGLPGPGPQTQANILAALGEED